MRLSDTKNRIFILTAIIGVALIYIRVLAGDFVLGTTTVEHPYIQFSAALIFAGLIALLMIPVLKSSALTKRNLFLLMGVGLLYRALFMGSVPIYEDDWNRYLWDGLVTVEGSNPYDYSPVEIIEGAQSDNPEVQDLHRLSNRDLYEGRNITRRINHPRLRTIYPPVAQAVFTIAAYIGPLNLDVLRSVYLLVEGYNVVHMDLLLMPPMLLAMLWVRQGAPIKAAAALAFASAVKLWPLILAPILFRRWRAQYGFYILIAATTAVMAIVFNLPLLLSIGESSGLSAYTGEWQRSSFIFPILLSFLEPLTDSPGQISRLFVAVATTLTALYYGFISKVDDDAIPLALMVTTGVLLFLSPTGYPWYLYWVLIFLPFVPSYGFALLSATVPLYYVRYAMGEQGIYHWYENLVVPLQFGLPLLLISYEIYRRDRHA